MSEPGPGAVWASYRRWFLIDGLVTGANAGAYLALHQLLPNLLGSTSALYLGAGIVLAVVTVGLLVVARARARLSVLAAVLVGINGLWAGGSFTAAVIGAFGLNGVGLAWVVAQGLIVLAFAVLQFRALRTSGADRP